MKKANIILAFAFAVAYAIFLSIGMECLLNLLAMSVAVSLDSGSAVKQYPRFIPFCIVVGLLALVAIGILFVFNIKASERFVFTKKIWCVQFICAFCISIPMIKPWEELFEFLHRVF